MRGSFNPLLGLATLLLQVGLLYAARTLAQSVSADWLLEVPLSILTGAVLWTSIPWLLLDRRVPWRRLVPTGLPAAVCSALFSVASTVYMPRLMETNSKRYGLFGVTLALVGWLLSVG